MLNKSPLQSQKGMNRKFKEDTKMTDINLVKNLRYRMHLLKERSIREINEGSIDVYSLEWLDFTRNFNTLMWKIDTCRPVKVSDVDRLSYILDYMID